MPSHTIKLSFINQLSFDAGIVLVVAVGVEAGIRTTIGHIKIEPVVHSIGCRIA